ncbi:hypothetical protein JTB14_011634 [Gonioctena quinquepunctata]|nr:hypothetical protein JTB14_011634 [Gonioctena quinquepunctata]
MFSSVQFVDDGFYHICSKKCVKDTGDGIIANWGPRTLYKACVMKSSNNNNELKQIKAILENSSILKVSLQKDDMEIQEIITSGISQDIFQNSLRTPETGPMLNDVETHNSDSSYQQVEGNGLGNDPFSSNDLLRDRDYPPKEDNNFFANDPEMEKDTHDEDDISIEQTGQENVNILQGDPFSSDDSLRDPDFDPEEDDFDKKKIGNDPEMENDTHDEDDISEEQTGQENDNILQGEFPEAAENQTIIPVPSRGIDKQEDILMNRVLSYSHPRNREMVEINRISKSRNGSKKYFCIFCKRLFSKLPEHLEKGHGNEEEVKKFFSLPKVSRRPRDSAKSERDYRVCPSCKGVYSEKSIRKHYRKCIPCEKKGDRSILILGKWVHGQVHENACPVLKNAILLVMREDEVIALIRRRAGKVERMMVVDFKNYQSMSSNNDLELLDNLSEGFKLKGKKYVRVEIRGKKSRGVVVLISSEVFKSYQLILNNREAAGVPDTNPYIFGFPGKLFSNAHLSACVLMGKYSEQSGILHPEHLRGTQLRKHIATQSAMMDLREHEVNDLANFMGHAEKIHREHNRISVVTRKIGRISQLLEMGVGDFNQDCFKNSDSTIVVSGYSSTNVEGTEDRFDTLLRSEKHSEHTDAEISGRSFYGDDDWRFSDPEESNNDHVCNDFCECVSDAERDRMDQNEWGPHAYP